MDGWICFGMDDLISETLCCHNRDRFFPQGSLPAHSADTSFDSRAARRAVPGGCCVLVPRTPALDLQVGLREGRQTCLGLRAVTE